VTSVFKLLPALALSCYQCSQDDCQKTTLVNCTVEVVAEGANYFKFLTKAKQQIASINYECVDFQGEISNGENFIAAGCIFSTYDICSDTVKYNWTKKACKVCNHRDGCNPATRATFSAGLALLLVAVCCRALVN
jgi:hypothetical protein